MELNWGLGTIEKDGKIYIVRVALLDDDFPKSDYPHRLTISWQYEPADDNGLPSSELNTLMTELEELVDKALEPGEFGLLITSILGDGSRQWHWHTKDSDETVERINAELGERTDFDVSLGISEDPDWTQYEKAMGLYEIAEKDELIEESMDLQLLEILRENGSDMTKPHHTIHYFYMPDKRSATAVANELKADGMTIARVDRMEEGEWACVMETYAIPETAAVLATSERLRALAESHGGRYDGWEAGVVNDSSEEEKEE